MPVYNVEAYVAQAQVETAGQVCRGSLTTSWARPNHVLAENGCPRDAVCCRFYLGQYGSEMSKKGWHLQFATLVLLAIIF
jgi:hypothetical protein